MEMRNFNFDKEINQILPPSQDTLWELFDRVKQVNLTEDDDSLDLCGEQIVVSGEELLYFQVQIHPFPQWDSERHIYKAVTLDQKKEDEAPYELWCNNDNDTFELRGPGKTMTEKQAQTLLGYFAPPEAAAA